MSIMYDVRTEYAARGQYPHVHKQGSHNCDSYYYYYSVIIKMPLGASCRIRSDRQTTSLTLTTGVCEAGTKMRGASNMNIYYDVTGLLTAAWRSHLGQIVWAA